MWHITHRQPWLIVSFPAPVTCLGWTVQGGGKQRTSSLLWREVRNADLTPDLDVERWLAAETRAIGQAEVPCFLTSAAIARFEEAEARVEGMRARVLVTLGLGNAERIGQRRSDPRPVGTINAALVVSAGLTDAAALEALSLLTEARTTAMLEHAPPLGPGAMTGTGTDCLAICYPPDAPRIAHTGKHTALGEAIGAAALTAFTRSVQRWEQPE